MLQTHNVMTCATVAVAVAVALAVAVAVEVAVAVAVAVVVFMSSDVTIMGEGVPSARGPGRRVL